MSRQDKSDGGKQSGRQGGNKKKYSGRQGGNLLRGSYSRGNSPLSKNPVDKADQLGKNEVRLNKFLAHSGICSRRDADVYIAAGNVMVNGKVVTEMGYKVKISDEVKFDGKSIKPEKPEYILLNKPKGFITTTSDEKGRSTVMELVSNATNSRILPVGRLDRGTTGLLLFTNDGDLAKKLTHPKHGIRKIYHVVLDKKLSGSDLHKIANGLQLEDGEILVDDVSYIPNASKNEVGVKIHSGRNRIVRRIFEHLGYQVVSLDRVVFAGLTKKDLPRGTWRKLTAQEVINLKML
ncbi:pseudouridine synthase [Robertkochia solimangrovi]|uniref:pseudouridine synthase n=1 Tax=Robertkochia solimangrovi TaxID=2213046 RepID=UPI0011808A00|nr:pseudouridine synthase [Robertkochia solimangrovi]TRZ43286.1 rRNA pseudouridine synthase [Robertkochia solimangrovi]